MRRSHDSAALATAGLTKRYGKVTALTDCTITVPEGRICALIGPNGAGKTTLLRLLAGLSRPTAGQVTVNGATPRQDPAFLADVGYLAQDIPLYRRLSAEDHIRAGGHLNPRWDAESVRERLASLKIPLDRAVGKLSGGQRAQVALALILAKRPRLLLLDEPVAALDPLARRNFLRVLTDGVAVGGLTVVLSSHLVADLERVCDHLIMLASSQVQLCGDIDDLLAEHQILTGPRKDTTAIERSHRVVQVTRTPRQTTLLVRLNGPVIDPAFEASDVSLEELVLGLHGAGRPAGPRPPDHGWRREMTWLVWRQHRVQFLAGAALLAAFAVLIVITGVQVANQYHAVQAACAAGHGCQHVGGGLFMGSHAVGFLVIATLGAPALVGLFWGAPMVAAEAEAGTTQFAWMQSVTRKRWLAVKIGWMLLAAAVWGGVISALVTWWEGPNNALQLDAFKPGRFDIMGVVPVAYSLFAMALGIAAGALTPPGAAGHGRHAGRVHRGARGDHAVAAPALPERGHRVLQGDQRLHAVRVLLAARAGHPRPERPAARAAGQHPLRRRRSRHLPPGFLQPGVQGCLHSPAVLHAGPVSLPRVPHLPAC